MSMFEPANMLLLGFGLGPQELLIVAVIGVLLFGKRLPEVGRSLGKGIVEFKRGVSGIESEIDDAVHNRNSSTSTPSHAPADDYEETSVPKFAPPSSEPTPGDEDTGTNDTEA